MIKEQQMQQLAEQLVDWDDACAGSSGGSDSQQPGCCSADDLDSPCSIPSASHDDSPSRTNTSMGDTSDHSQSMDPSTVDSHSGTGTAMASEHNNHEDRIDALGSLSEDEDDEGDVRRA